MNWDAIEGLREAVGDVHCADCEWSIEVRGIDPAAVHRAMQVALADHRRDCHYLVR